MRREKEQPGCMLYWDSLESIVMLDAEEVKQLMILILNYGRDGKEPQKELKGGVKILWPMIFRRLKADKGRYEEVRSRNQLKGHISNFKRNYAPIHGLNPEDPEQLNAYLKECGISEELLFSAGRFNRCAPDQPITVTDTVTTTVTDSKTKTNTNSNSISESYTASISSPEMISRSISEEQKQKRLLEYGSLLKTYPAASSGNADTYCPVT